jgi:hypothetical protein
MGIPAEGMEHLGTVADLCAKHPDHPVCDLARRGGDGGHARSAGHHPGAAGDGGSGGVWDNPLDSGPDNGGNLDWFPFS